MIKGTLCDIKLGDQYPVRIMAVINLSRESFYKGSVTGPADALTRAQALVDEGADILDLGAVSTAPGAPAISLAEERGRMMPVIKAIASSLEVGISVDTQRAAVADEALTSGATCINDVSGLCDSAMARTVADHDASAVILASKKRPGDLLTMDEVIPLLSERIRSAIEMGISPDKMTVDPGIGHWIPDKFPEYDLALLDGMRRLRVLGKPVMAALSRKSFLGSVLSRPDPSERLLGTLAATAIAVYNGAHVVRTHDVAASLDTINVAMATRGRIPFAGNAEILSWLGQGNDLQEALRRIEVDEGGVQVLCKKGSFRVISLSNLSSMEAIVIKQEMLALGGDAATPKLALRCDPSPEDVLVMGTISQITRLVKRLERQPFSLPAIGKAIDAALKQIDDPKRYR